MSRFELLFSVLFFMKERIDFSQPILMRNEKEKEKKTKTISRSKQLAREKENFLSHKHLKEPRHKTTEREDDFYDDIDDDQNGFNTTTKIFVFSFLFLPKL